MKEKLRKLLYFYQKIMWFTGIANSEARKPLFFVNETLLILTFLTVRGVIVGTYETIAIYIIFLILLAIAGKVLVMMGIVSYVTKINNQQNPELMKILKEVEDIKEELKRIKVDK